MRRRAAGWLALGSALVMAAAACGTETFVDHEDNV